MPQDPPLSKRETQIMDIIYAHGHATAAQVAAAMPDQLSSAAVRTFLRILEEKGHLTHRLQGRRFIFKPTRPRVRAGQSAFRRVLEVFFGGSLEAAVAAHLADRDGNCNPVELEKMAALIEKSRQEGR